MVQWVLAFVLSPALLKTFAADGHFWPESYYLGALQARQALFEVRLASRSKVHRVLSYIPGPGELSEEMGAHIAAGHRDCEACLLREREQDIQSWTGAAHTVMSADPGYDARLIYVSYGEVQPNTSVPMIPVLLLLFLVNDVQT